MCGGCTRRSAILFRDLAFAGGGVDLTASLPFEVATAVDLAGPYALADLEKLLATGIEQWKGYESLTKESENYTVRLNELIKSAGTLSFFKLGSSFKPVLVSIGRIGAKSFSVVSIRSCDVRAGGFISLNAAKLSFMSIGRVIVRRVNASADLIRGSPDLSASTYSAC